MTASMAEQGVLATSGCLGGSVDLHDVRVGDRVRVRSSSHVLTTLDQNATVGGLPFMPEMLAFAGRTFTVDAVVHRTCDTVKTDGGSGTTRTLPGTLHLRGVRCTGEAHGGCQARCLIYWKQEWLEPAPPEEAASLPAVVDASEMPRLLAETTRGQGSTDEEPVYRCQATEMTRATCFISGHDLRPMVKDVRSGNATLRQALVAFTVQVFNKWQGVSQRLPRWLRIHGGAGWPWYDPAQERRGYPVLGLEPGDLVEVRSQSEIESTLDERGRLRGLRFGAEMLPYCGKRARVLARVERIIDERTGRMLKLRDCTILEDVWCQGTFRLLCRRKIFLYWREAWLRRVDETAASSQ